MTRILHPGGERQRIQLIGVAKIRSARKPWRGRAPPTAAAPPRLRGARRVRRAGLTGRRLRAGRPDFQRIVGGSVSEIRCRRLEAGTAAGRASQGRRRARPCRLRGVSRASWAGGRPAEGSRIARGGQAGTKLARARGRRPLLLRNRSCRLLRWRVSPRRSRGARSVTGRPARSPMRCANEGSSRRSVPAVSGVF